MFLHSLVGFGPTKDSTCIFLFVCCLLSHLLILEFALGFLGDSGPFIFGLDIVFSSMFLYYNSGTGAL